MLSSLNKDIIIIIIIIIIIVSHFVNLIGDGLMRVAWKRLKQNSRYSWINFKLEFQK